MTDQECDSSSPQWQCLYPKGRAAYWWDYPPEVNAKLEDAVSKNEDVMWVWDWGNNDRNGKAQIDRFVLSPKNKTQLNVDKGKVRQMRRIVLESPPVGVNRPRGE